MRVPEGGAYCLGVLRPGSGALPLPTTRPFERAAGAHYRLAAGAGDAGVGTRHQPHSTCSCELALRALGAARVHPGGAPLAWVWGVRGPVLSHPPTTRPFGRAAGAHYPLAVGAGDAGVWSRNQPHSARSCELDLRAVGAAQARLGGAPLAWVSGVPGRVLSHPRPLVLPVVRPGPTTHWLPVRGPRAWRPITNPTARALVCWLGALLGRHKGAGGARLLPGFRASGVGCSPTPDHLSFRACSRGPLPTGCWCGGCRPGDPSPTPQRALLRVGLARCGGGGRAPGGGASCLGVGLPGSGALPPPTTRHFGRAAGAHYQLAAGAGGAGVGTRHKPHSARSCELAFRVLGRHEGARGGRLLPGSGASGVGRSPSPDHSSFRACGRGPLPTGCGCGGCGRGDQSQTPQRALLRAGFAHCGGGTRAPGGGAPLAFVWGVRGQALPHPRPLVLSGVRPGPTTHWLSVRGVRAWRPVTNPTARALGSLLCALWGWHEGAGGGGATCLDVGCPGSGALPCPTTRPFGHAAVAHYPLALAAGVAGVGTRQTPDRVRSCELALRAVKRHEGARGQRLLPGCAASGVGCSPTPDDWSFRACGWGPLPTGCGCGACGLGTRHQLHSARSCELAWRAVGAARGRLGGGSSCLGVGRPGSGPLPLPTTRPFGRAAGALYPLAVVAGGAGVGTRHQPHSARSCDLASRAVRAARGCPGGGASCLGVGCPGSGALRPPTA